MGGPALAAGVALLLAGGGVRAQGDGLELLLRDGTVLAVRALHGQDAAGLEAELAAGGARRRIAARDLVAVLGRAAAPATLPAVYLAGGDVVRGAFAGGDAGGNRLELLSPVLGRVAIAIDRVEVLTTADIAAPVRFQLPDTVDEALFVEAGTGIDVVAGALHQLGEQGVRFQPEGSESPRWFAPQEFLALRLRGAIAAERAAPATMLTRTGDRLGVTIARWAGDVVHCEIEGGAAVALRLTDLAAVAFHRDVVFLSDVPPAAVEESGYDGDVVHPFRADRNALGGALVTGGRAYAKGLGVHARSRLSFVVPEGCERFWTRVGFDDSATALGIEPAADVRVLVGDELVFERENLRAGQPPVDTGLVTVRAGDTVTLEVDAGRGRDLGDRVNWLQPMLLPAPARRP